MFTTSRMNAGELLAHFLDLRGVSAEDTKAFVNLKHNADLCPRFRLNVDSLVASYKSYRTDVADIQGMTDDGVDVLLRYDTEGKIQKRTGLQIKSHDEFEEWRRLSSNTRGGRPETSMVEKLLAQKARAVSDAQINDYYIVLCVDAKKHQERIRQISSAFKNHADVKVITPEKALAFFAISPLKLSLQLTRLLCADDPLLQSVRVEMAHLDSDLTNMYVHLVHQAFEDGPFRGEGVLVEKVENLVRDYPDRQRDGRNAVQEVIEGLETRGAIRRDGTRYEINIANLPVSLCALYFDQRYRRGADGGDLEHYLCELISLE